MATTTKNPKSKTQNPKPAKVATKPHVAVVAKPAVVSGATAGRGRVLTGLVTSDKMTQTVTVEVTRLVAHPLYHKRLRRSKKFHAHNEMGAKKGDMVEITETRPMSKTKFFIVTKVLNK